MTQLAEGTLNALTGVAVPAPDHHLEDHLGAAFYSLQEPFLSTATADKQQRELLLSIVAWAARWESQRKSDRLKAKVKAKRNRAESLGQNARWGRGRLASDVEIATVRALRARGNSVRAISVAVGISKSQVQRIARDSTQATVV